MANENLTQNLSLEVNNITLSYNDVGEDGSPVIFVHGFPFNKSVWKSQLEALKSSNRVLSIDLRGFGKSTPGKTKLSIDLFSEDLIAFMDKLKIERAILCGLSMGGYIALNAIKRFSERFEALILCDTRCSADTDEGKKKRYDTIEEVNNNGTAAFTENFIKSVFHRDSFKTKKTAVESLRSIVIANPEETITAGLAAMAERSETCSSLEAIRVPTLIICGREDEVTPLAQSEFMHKHIEGSILKIIDNAGHVSNLEQPEEFNKFLKDFIDRLNASKFVQARS